MKKWENKEKVIKELGGKIEFGKYQYWDNVCFAIFENGAKIPLVFDCFCNGSWTIDDLEKVNISKKQILKSIQFELEKYKKYGYCENLGHFELINNNNLKLIFNYEEAV